MTIPVVAHLLGLHLLYVVTAKPTIGFMEWHQLETYEDPSYGPNDTDIFGNLTFEFSCTDRPVGLYADKEYACRVFHACDGAGDDVVMVCANGTSFNQRLRVCDWEYDVDCENAHEWYYLNEFIHVTESSKEYDQNPIEQEEVLTVLPLESP